MPGLAEEWDVEFVCTGQCSVYFDNCLYCVRVGFFFLREGEGGLAHKNPKEKLTAYLHSL